MKSNFGIQVIKINLEVIFKPFMANSNLCTLTCTCKMIFGNFVPQNIAIYNFYLKKGWLKHNTENILYYPCFMGEVTNQKWSEVLIDCDLTRKV